MACLLCVSLFAAESMNPSLFATTNPALISPGLVFVCTTVPGNERIFLVFPFFVFKEQQRGGISRLVSTFPEASG